MCSVLLDASLAVHLRWMLALLLVDTMGGLLSELTVRPYYKLEKFIAAKQIPAVHTIKDRQLLNVADASPSAFSHGTWDALLRAYVKADRTFGEVTGATGVDYAGLSADARFDEYRASLAAADVEALPAPDQLALWMNAYNALCIGLLVDDMRNRGVGTPTASINDLGTKKADPKNGVPVWDLPAGTVGGRAVSLNEIEHAMLRAKWAEPAVHACIVCASASCPNLRAEAFAAPAANLRAQMDDQLASWLANPTKGAALREAQKELLVSRIFLWFAEDFAADRFAAIDALQPKLPAAIGERVAAWRRGGPFGGKRLGLRYFVYDWQVNDASGSA